MAIFVTLSEGPESADAVPFLVVDDATVAREVATIIARRLGLGVAARNQRPVVRVIRSPSEPDDGGMP
jgi:hypothetical protein